MSADTEAALAQALADLAHPEDVRRVAAAAALGASGDVRAADTLLPELSHADDYYWLCNVAQALGHLQDPRAVAPLAALLAHPVDHVPAAVIEALGRIGGEEAVAALRGFYLADRRADLTDAAAQALHHLGVTDLVWPPPISPESPHG